MCHRSQLIMLRIILHVHSNGRLKDGNPLGVHLCHVRGDQAQRNQLAKRLCQYGKDFSVAKKTRHKIKLNRTHRGASPCRSRKPDDGVFFRRQHQHFHFRSVALDSSHGWGHKNEPVQNPHIRPNVGYKQPKNQDP